MRSDLGEISLEKMQKSSVKGSYFIEIHYLCIVLKI